MLFDAGDVLYHRPRRGDLLKPFLSAMGLPKSPPDQERLTDLKRQAHAGQLTKEQYQDAMLALYGIFDPSSRVRGRQLMDEEQADIDFFDGVPETLHRLKKAGVRLGVVTNTFNPTNEKLEWFRRVKIDSIWDSFATSCELKICKPDPRIYRAALDPLGVRPEDAAFVGHATTELDGAKSLGLHTIAFNRDNDMVVADYILWRFSELLALAGIDGS